MKSTNAAQPGYTLPWIRIASLANFALLGILLLGLALRLVNWTNPPLDFHTWRQLRSASIARGMYYQMDGNADPVLKEKAVETSRLFGLLEPNLFERIVAVTYLAIGKEFLPIARLYSIFFWMVGGLALYDMIRRISSRLAALTGLAFYLVLPFGVTASRSFQPDPFMLMWVLLAINALYRWTESQSWKWAALTGVFGGIAILIKVFAVFPLGITCILMALTTWGLARAIKSPQVWLAVALMGLIPSIYYFISIPGAAGEYIGGWVTGFQNLLSSIRFYFQWMGYLDSLVGLIFVFLGGIGLFAYPPKGRILAVGLWTGYILYGLTVPSLIITHSYYNLPLVPIVAFSLAPYGELIYSRLSQLPGLWRLAAIAAIVAAILYPSWLIRNNQVSQDYALEPRIWQRIGESLPKNAKIIALTHDYNTRIIYYGWTPVGSWVQTADIQMNIMAGGNNDPNDPAWKEIFDQRTRDFDYFLVTLMGELGNQPVIKNILYENYPYTEGDGYILFDLKHPRSISSQP